MVPPARPRTLASVDRFFQFSLLGLVASGFLALASSGYPDRATVLLTLTALIARTLATAGLIRIEIPPKIVTAAALGYVVFFPIDYYLISRDFLASTVHGVCFLAAVKILTARSNRDYMYTGAVAFLELIGAALLSFQASFFGWLALYILFTIAAFTSAEIRRSVQRSRNTAYPASTPRMGWRLTMVACMATGGILALTAGLFLLVPRTARAAAMLFPNAPHLTGFSNIVDLGTFGEISKDNRPVLHVLAYSHPLPPNLKWRGAALSHFDGVRWSEPPLADTEVTAHYGAAEVAGLLQRSRRDGHRMLYRVEVSASDTGTLFIAGIPEYINFAAPHLMRTSEDSFRILPVTGEDLQYEVSAHSGPSLPEPLPESARGRYLRLPPVDTRIWALAREWSGTGPPIEKALRIQRHLRRDFTYTLEASPAPVRDPLARFLFESKRGYCEYFASSMAVMLRTLGIPSRVVTGFQSGYFNDVSGLYVIRASDAHAWVEAWFDGLGWLTFDPTPAGAPGRGATLSDRIGMYFDAADSLWSQWVVAYDLGHQAQLAARLANTLRRWNRPGPGGGSHWGTSILPLAKRWGGWLVSLGLLTAILAIGIPRWLRAAQGNAAARRIVRHQSSPTDAAILYRKMLETLEDRGFEKPAWFTPVEFAKQLPGREGELVARFTAVYNDVRFGRASSSQAGGELVELLRLVKASKTYK
jgi:transglutaminase-like putative cysteine protease